MSKIDTRPFDVAHYLQTEADNAEYLGQVVKDGDPAELAAALDDIAKVRSLEKPPKDSGLSFEILSILSNEIS